jgi:very-short-patch-repair endonuclease
MRASRAGYKHTQETKNKIGSKHRGKTRTPEEIDKWRASYAEYIAENGSPMTGKPRSDEFKKKMSDIAKARTPEMVQAKVEQMWAARRGSIATDEQRERYSQARLKFMRENPEKLVTKLFNTRPEREFAVELDNRGLTYERNVQVGGRVYDFRLEDMVLIEIDGPYHWNYKMYGNKEMPDAKRMALFEEAKKKDVYKNELAVKHGYTLYRIKVEGGLPIDWIAQLNNQGFQI